MIKIELSKTADSRTCSVEEVTQDRLMQSSMQHISDVAKGMEFFSDMLYKSAVKHDFDKLSKIQDFYKDFSSDFESKEWLNKHYEINRHHLATEKGIPVDVNLIDVIEMVVDCVMASVGRGGKQFPIEIDNEVLMRAFDNTVRLLKKNVELVE